MDGTKYGIGDYAAFGVAAQTSDVLKGKATELGEAVKGNKNSIDEGVFMGPIADNCRDAIDSLAKQISTCEEGLTLVHKLLNEANENYKKGDYDAIHKALSITDGTTETAEQVTEANSNTGKVNQDYIYNFLAEQGFNKAAICGILANIECESSFKTSSLGDKGTSYGICQWHNSRWTRLKKYCKENGLDSSSIEGQSKFLVHELKTYYPSVYKTLKNVPNTRDGAYQAAAAWTIHYEVPKNKGAQAKKRGSKAQATYWDSYSKT